ncbi:MAG: glycosyltransferase family 87 protein [Vicingaceae bacterium]
MSRKYFLLNQSVRQALISIWLISAACFILYKGAIPAWQDKSSDFSNYYTSAALLKNGESLAKFYDTIWFDKKAKEVGVKEGAKFSPFPPATAFLYLPLTVMPPLVAKRFWMICNLLLLFILIYQIKKLGSSTFLESAFLFSLFMTPIASNIRLGQSYLLFTLFLTTFLLGIRNKKQLLSGSLLGIASSLKYFPIVYLFYAIKLKRKLILGLLVGVTLTLSAPIFIDGLDPYYAFLKEFWNHLNGNLSMQGQFSFSFQSVDALLANLFIFDAELNKTPTIAFPLLKSIIKMLFVAVIVSLSLWVFKKKVQTPEELTIAIIVIGAFLIVPASATYHLLLILPALYLAINLLKKEGNFKKEIITILLLIFLTCNLLPHHIPYLPDFPTLNTIIHFPRLYGLIALFAFLIILQKRLSQNHG